MGEVGRGPRERERERTSEEDIYDAATALLTGVVRYE